MATGNLSASEYREQRKATAEKEAHSGDFVPA